MIRSSLLAMLAICAVCSFCGKEFVTLGRHTWRCKERLREDFLQIRVSSAQKSNESDSRLRNLGKVKMAGNFFIVRVFPESIYKHNRNGLVPF